MGSGIGYVVKKTLVSASIMNRAKTDRSKVKDGPWRLLLDIDTTYFIFEFYCNTVFLASFVMVIVSCSISLLSVECSLDTSVCLVIHVPEELDLELLFDIHVTVGLLRRAVLKKEQGKQC